MIRNVLSSSATRRRTPTRGPICVGPSAPKRRRRSLVAVDVSGWPGRVVGVLDSTGSAHRPGRPARDTIRRRGVVQPGGALLEPRDGVPPSLRAGARNREAVQWRSGAAANATVGRCGPRRRRGLAPPAVRRSRERFARGRHGSVHALSVALDARCDPAIRCASTTSSIDPIPRLLPRSPGRAPGERAERRVRHELLRGFARTVRAVKLRSVTAGVLSGARRPHEARGPRLRGAVLRVLRGRPRSVFDGAYSKQEPVWTTRPRSRSAFEDARRAVDVGRQ
jgi:hypothetical protein